MSSIRLKVFCQSCTEHIANIDPFALRSPLSGGVFESPDPTHDIPPPFLGDDADFEHMTCPYGRNHKPFNESDKILTEAGILWVRPGEPPSLVLLPPTGMMDRPASFRNVVSISEEDAERMVRARLNQPVRTEPQELSPAIALAPPDEVLVEMPPAQQSVEMFERTETETHSRGLRTEDAINQIVGTDPFAETHKAKGKRK